MEKTMLVAAVIAVAGMQIQTARAGDREWATAGRILTGVAIGAVIANAVDAHASYSVTYASVPAYCAPLARVVYASPVVWAPSPFVVYRPPVVCALPVRYVRYDHYGVRGHYRQDGYDRHDRGYGDGRRGRW